LLINQRSKMDTEIKENVIKGREAERKFKKWLDDHYIPYLYIHQDTDTFSSAFNK